MENTYHFWGLVQPDGFTSAVMKMTVAEAWQCAANLPEGYSLKRVP